MTESVSILDQFVEFVITKVPFGSIMLPFPKRHLFSIVMTAVCGIIEAQI